MNNHSEKTLDTPCVKHERQARIVSSLVIFGGTRDLLDEEDAFVAGVAS